MTLQSGGARNNGRISAKLPNEKAYVYDLLEDSVDVTLAGIADVRNATGPHAHPQ